MHLFGGPMTMYRLLLAGVLAGGLCLVPAAAQADSHTTRDARHDLQSGNDETEVWTPQPQRAEGDIVWTRVAHRSKSIRVRIKYAELAKVDGGGETTVFLRNGRKTFIWSVNASYGNWRGYSDFSVEDLGCNCRERIQPRPAKKYACKSRTHKIDYADSSILMVIPRSCIDNPRFVRTAITSSRGWDSGISAGPSDSPDFTDVAGSSKRFPTDLFPPRVYGPRVYR